MVVNIWSWQNLIVCFEQIEIVIYFLYYIISSCKELSSSSSYASPCTKVIEGECIGTSWRSCRSLRSYDVWASWCNRGTDIREGLRLAFITSMFLPSHIIIRTASIGTRETSTNSYSSGVSVEKFLRIINNDDLRGWDSTSQRPGVYIHPRDAHWP